MLVFKNFSNFTCDEWINSELKSDLLDLIQYRTSSEGHHQVEWSSGLIHDAVDESHDERRKRKFSSYCWVIRVMQVESEAPLLFSKGCSYEAPFKPLLFFSNTIMSLPWKECSKVLKCEWIEESFELNLLCWYMHLCISCVK